MKTDRELLELAAKAAGMEISFHDGLIRNATGMHGMANIYAAPFWNPPTDDGDALRLAVKLRISVGPEDDDVIGQSLVRVSWLNRVYTLGEYGDGDPYAATRRAIVRAAASIGEKNEH